MAETPETPHGQPDEQPVEQSLSDRLLDLFVFLPTGVVVTVAEELPKLAERGRDRLGVHVNSARAVGQFAVTAGGHELKRRSAGRGRPSTGPAAPPTRKATTRLRTIPYPEDRPPSTGPPPAPASGAAPTPPAAAPSPPPAPAPASPADVPATASGGGVRPTATVARPPVDAHVPAVATLAIPGFDTLSASQVVQRLDGLSRPELVAVRAYETSTRGRRTILSRVDQLLDERS
jgi:hypothetical protein